MLTVATKIVTDSGLAKDVFAAFMAGLAGFAVIIYAASSDLFDLKIFKFDPFVFKLPRETRVEFWYTRAARKFESILTGGGWNYAKAKKRARVVFKREGRRLRRETRKMLPEAVRRLNRDIALGTLAIAIILVALFILRLV